MWGQGLALFVCVALCAALVVVLSEFPEVSLIVVTGVTVAVLACVYLCGAERRLQSPAHTEWILSEYARMKAAPQNQGPETDSWAEY